MAIRKLKISDFPISNFAKRKVLSWRNVCKDAFNWLILVIQHQKKHKIKVNGILTKWPHLKKGFVIHKAISNIQGKELIIYQKFSIGWKKRKGNGDTAIPAKKDCLFWGCGKPFTNISRRTRLKYYDQPQWEVIERSKYHKREEKQNSSWINIFRPREYDCQDLVKMNVFIDKFPLLSNEEQVLILKFYLLLSWRIS